MHLEGLEAEGMPEDYPELILLARHRRTYGRQAESFECFHWEDDIQ